MTSNRVASPVATGGGGEQFEQHVAALALGLLLVRGTPPVLKDTSVVEVHMQTGYLGWGTDDLLLVGERGDGSRRRLALQAKRSFRVSRADAECRKTIAGMWNDFQSDRFDEAHDQLAVATLHGTWVLLRDFAALLDCARASTDAVDFARRLDGFLSGKAKEQERTIRRILEDEVGGPPDGNAYWRFLRAINVLSFDLNTPSSQHEAWMVSLLAACVTDGSASLEATRASWVALLACAGRGRPTAKRYTRKDLPQELRDRHAPVSAANRGGLTALIWHGETVRDAIHSTIGEEYAVDRSANVQALGEKVAEHQIVIVSGEAGSGKSALARQLLAQLDDRCPVLAFQAVELATAHIDETLANAQTTLNAQRLFALLAGAGTKIVFVDGVERLLERSIRDGFAQLLNLGGRDPSTRILLTVRDYSLETVRNALIPAGLEVAIFEVPPLTDAELDGVATGVPALADALGNDSLRAFLRTPYLVDLASRLRWEKASLPATLREFRRKVWRELIRDDGHEAGGMPGRRERAFLDIAWRRAVELRPFVAPEVNDPEALGALRRDSLVAVSQDSSAVYAVTHDVLEDWGVLRRIDDRFAQGGGLLALEKAVGGYPALRRGLRQWLFERFEEQSDEAQALVLEIVADGAVAGYFRDDCLVAALLSESAAGFIGAIRLRMAHGDLELLDRITHILRVACQASPKWFDVPGLPSPMLVPTGSGWAPALSLVLDLMDVLLPGRTALVLGLVEDWAKQVYWGNPQPAGTAEAGAIVDRLLKEFADDGAEDARLRTLKVAAKIPQAVPQFKDLIDRASTCSPADQTAFDLLDVILTKPEGASVCGHFPDEVVTLLNARLRLSEADREHERGLMGSVIEEVDYVFGVRDLPMDSYHPPSALQGPFSALLANHPRKAVDFILGLLNHAGTSYVTALWPDRVLEPATEVSLAIPGRGTVKQWANRRLYGLYRGNQVGPDSLTSMLMALESWLLRIGEMDGNDLEGWLVHLLSVSNNVMVTGIVASVCVACPDKAGRAGLALLSSREVVQLDRRRLASESGSAFDAFFGLNPHNRLFEQERGKSNELAHRREDLESLAVRMQLGDHREAVWEILDRHRVEVPEDSGEESRVWRLALHRMDVRGYERQDVPGGPENDECGDQGKRVYFRPGKMEADVQGMVEEASASLEILNRHLALQNIARKVWERDASVREVNWRTALLAEAQAIERELDEPEEFSRDGPGFAAAVCIRDHLDELDDAAFVWCAQRVDFEVRRNSEGVDLTNRVGRIESADRFCASVVPLLAAHGREVDGIDRMGLLALALTHPIDQVTEYAFGGLGAFVDEAHSALIMHCVAAAAYRCRLALESWVKAHRRRRMFDGPDPLRAAVPIVRKAIETGSLDAVAELERLDFGSPMAGGGVRAALTVFERRPDWEESGVFYSRVAHWLADAWRADRSRIELPVRDYRLEAVAHESLASFVLGVSADLAMQICTPVVEAVVAAPDKGQWFVSKLILGADRSTGDCFWDLWQAIADAIVHSPWGTGLTNETKFDLGLLSMIFLGPFWKEDARDWHRLDGHTGNVDELALSLPATVPVARAYCDYLNRIGHQSLPGSFVVVGRMLENGDAMRIASDSGVAFGLETLLRPFVYSEPHRIKTDTRLRKAILVILDALVAGGSASAYRMRDDFVTPSSGG